MGRPCYRRLCVERVEREVVQTAKYGGGRGFEAWAVIVYSDGTRIRRFLGFYESREEAERADADWLVEGEYEYWTAEGEKIVLPAFVMQYLRRRFDEKIDKLMERLGASDIDEGPREAITEKLSGVVRLYRSDGGIVNVYYAADLDKLDVEVEVPEILQDYEGLLD